MSGSFYYPTLRYRTSSQKVMSMNMEFWFQKISTIKVTSNYVGLKSCIYPGAVVWNYKN